MRIVVPRRSTFNGCNSSSHSTVSRVSGSGARNVVRNPASANSTRCSSTSSGVRSSVGYIADEIALVSNRPRPSGSRFSHSHIADGFATSGTSASVSRSAGLIMRCLVDIGSSREAPDTRGQGRIQVFGLDGEALGVALPAGTEDVLGVRPGGERGREDAAQHAQRLPFPGRVSAALADDRVPAPIEPSLHPRPRPRAADL